MSFYFCSINENSKARIYSHPMKDNNFSVQFWNTCNSYYIFTVSYYTGNLSELKYFIYELTKQFKQEE